MLTTFIAAIALIATQDPVAGQGRAAADAAERVATAADYAAAIEEAARATSEMRDQEAADASDAHLWDGVSDNRDLYHCLPAGRYCDEGSGALPRASEDLWASSVQRRPSFEEYRKLRAEIDNVCALATMASDEAFELKERPSADMAMVYLHARIWMIANAACSPAP